MAEILSGSIDLNKIDKSKIKEVKKKDGSIAKYYDITIFINNEQDQYNNIASVSQGQSKEESQNKTPKTFIGSLKRMWSDNAPKLEQPKNNSNEDNKDDLPF